jgi:hypothetical protein
MLNLTHSPSNMYIVYREAHKNYFTLESLTCGTSIMYLFCHYVHNLMYLYSTGVCLMSMLMRENYYCTGKANELFTFHTTPRIQGVRFQIRTVHISHYSQNIWRMVSNTNCSHSTLLPEYKAYGFKYGLFTFHTTPRIQGIWFQKQTVHISHYSQNIRRMVSNMNCSHFTLLPEYKAYGFKYELFTFHTTPRI